MGERQQHQIPYLSLKPIKSAFPINPTPASSEASTAEAPVLRPWGQYQVLERRDTYVVKTLSVNPGEATSYQRHQSRSEYWVVVNGYAEVVLEGETLILTPGSSIEIPRHSAHRLSNPGETPLVVIETQLGDWLSEDDIIRLEDRYGRAQ